MQIRTTRETIYLLGDAYVFNSMKICMNRTAVGNALARSKTGSRDANGPLWRRIVEALACPAARWAGLGMLTLMAVLCLATIWVPVASRGGSAGQGGWLVGWGGQPGLTCDRYFKDGLWRADIRTTLEVVQYVFSPDLGPWGPPVLPQPVPFLSATTNQGTSKSHV